MGEHKYSIKDLEELVKNGFMEKRIKEWSYGKEFLSRLGLSLVAGAIPGVLFTALGAFGQSINKDYDIPGLGVIFAISTATFAGLAGGTVGFYKWKEEAEPFVKGGGKLIYADRKTGRKIVLPLNNSYNREEKLTFGQPFRGYFDSGSSLY